MFLSISRKYSAPPWQTPSPAPERFPVAAILSRNICGRDTSLDCGLEQAGTQLATHILVCESGSAERNSHQLKVTLTTLALSLTEQGQLMKPQVILTQKK